MMTNKGGIDDSLRTAATSFTEGWLSNSASIAELAKHRQHFDSAFKTGFLDQLHEIGLGGLFQLSELVGDSKEKSTLILKTIPTPFPYYPCIDNSSGNQDSIKSDIQLLVEKIGEAQGIASNAGSYLIFTMYPCTTTDKYLKPYIQLIEEATGIKLSAIEYRFTNNAPGVLYIAKLSFSGEKKLKPAEPIFETASRITGNEIASSLGSKSRSRLRVGLAQNSYIEILTEIHEQMKRDNEEIGFEELQSRFEKKVREKLKMQLPFLNESEIDERMKAFESKGTGAKKAQILLCTINEPSRIHYRPEIPANSPFNLFVYKEYSGYKIPVRERKIKAFDPKDKSIQDVYIIHSKINKKGEKAIVIDDKVRVRDLK